MSDRWKEICQSGSAVTFDPMSCCHPAQAPDESPIDTFFRTNLSLLRIGTSSALTADENLGGILLLGLVSNFEAFIKEILSNLIRLCPFCRKNSSKQTISFGAFDYYGADNIEASLLERVSIATEGELKKHTEKLTGLRLSGSELDEAIKLFNQVCQLRHAAVHFRGHLSVLNAIAIAEDSPMDRLALDLNFGNIQDIGLICTNLAREYNRSLFVGVVDRWITSMAFSGEWQNDKCKFNPVFTAFYSRTDGVGPKNAYQSYRLFRPEIIKRLSGTT